MRKTKLTNNGGKRLTTTTLNRGQVKLSQVPQTTTMRMSHTNLTLTKHTKEGSSRRVGDKAEAQMKHEVESNSSIKIQDTRNSGALYYDGDFNLILSDVVGDYIRCEGKYRNTTGFTINKKHWNEIKEKALKHGGTPALVNQNDEGEVLITMSLKHFAQIVNRNV